MNHHWDNYLFSNIIEYKCCWLVWLLAWGYTESYRTACPYWCLHWLQTHAPQLPTFPSPSRSNCSPEVHRHTGKPNKSLPSLSITFLRMGKKCCMVKPYQVAWTFTSGWVPFLESIKNESVERTRLRRMKGTGLSIAINRDLTVVLLSVLRYILVSGTECHTSLWAAQETNAPPAKPFLFLITVIADYFQKINISIEYPYWHLEGC